MRSFHRYWTLQLQTDIDNFHDAFVTIVHKDRFQVIIPAFRARIDKDYFGSIQNNNSFNIRRRDDVAGWASGDSMNVLGKMIPEGGGLKLELRLDNPGYSKYPTIFWQAVVSSFVFGLLLNALIGLFYVPPDGYSMWYLVAEWVVLFILMFYVCVKLTHYYIDLRVKDFNRVLRAIEELAKN
jgi:hypothetical protein